MLTHLDVILRPDPSRTVVRPFSRWRTVHEGAKVMLMPISPASSQTNDAPLWRTERSRLVRSRLNTAPAAYGVS